MFAKAAAKQTASLPSVQKDANIAPVKEENCSTFESKNSPGKENRINVNKEKKEKDLKIKDEKSDIKVKDEDNIQKHKDEKPSKLDNSSNTAARSNRKRESSSKKSNLSQAKRRKRIQVRYVLYYFYEQHSADNTQFYFK